jgi:hypothetical protein
MTTKTVWLPGTGPAAWTSPGISRLVGDWDSITENSSTQYRTHGDAHELLTADSQSLQHDVKGNQTLIPAVLRPGSTDPLALTWDFDNRLSSADVDNDSVAT